MLVEVRKVNFGAVYPRFSDLLLARCVCDSWVKVRFCACVSLCDSMVKVTSKGSCDGATWGLGRGVEPWYVARGALRVEGSRGIG